MSMCSRDTKDANSTLLQYTNYVFQGHEFSAFAGIRGLSQVMWAIIGEFRVVIKSDDKVAIQFL